MVRIYHTSDLHDHRGIAPRLKAMRRAEPGLLFDCGDSLRGSQTMYYRNEPIVAEMDSAGYDAQAIGNREFHYLFGLLRARAGAHAPSAGVQQPHRRQGPRAAVPAGAAIRGAGERRRGDERPRARSAGDAISTRNSIWENMFGWSFIDPVGVVEEYAIRSASATCSSCCRISGSRAIAGWHSACRESTWCWGDTVTTRWKYPSTSAEYRSCTQARTAGSSRAASSRTTQQRGRFALTDFALVPLLAGP